MWVKMFKTLKKLKDTERLSLLLHPLVIGNSILRNLEKKYKRVYMLSRPNEISIELNNLCNFNCIQCLRSNTRRKYKYGRISFEDFKKIFDQFKYITGIALDGFGEPFLYKDLFEIIKYIKIKKRYCYVLLFTNGDLINKDICKKLIEHKVSEVNISLDATTEESYKKIRRGGNLKKVLTNIRTLIDMKKKMNSKLPLVGINFILMNENEGELKNFIKLAEDLKVDHIASIRVAMLNWGYKNKRSVESFIKELKEAKKVLNKTKIKCYEDLIYKPESLYDFTKIDYYCPFLWGDIFQVTFSGDVTLGCCTPFKEQYSYGNLLKTKLDKLWNNEKFLTNRLKAKKNISPNIVCEACVNYRRNFF